ncbi:hypothetical protein L209DRAFT_753694 [Thermothelomyces heterothallicus CBS 203.75]
MACHPTPLIDQLATSHKATRSPFHQSLQTDIHRREATTPGPVSTWAPLKTDSSLNNMAILRFELARALNHASISCSCKVSDSREVVAVQPESLEKPGVPSHQVQPAVRPRLGLLSWKERTEKAGHLRFVLTRSSDSQSFLYNPSTAKPITAASPRSPSVAPELAPDPLVLQVASLFVGGGRGSLVA